MRSDTGAAVLVAVLSGLLFYAPEHAAARFSLSEAALNRVAVGAGLCMACAALAALAALNGWDGLAVVLLWPAWEAGMYAAARLAFPLDRLPPTPPDGVTLGELAFGRWTNSAGFWIAAMALLYLVMRGRLWLNR